MISVHLAQTAQLEEQSAAFELCRPRFSLSPDRKHLYVGTNAYPNRLYRLDIGEIWEFGSGYTIFLSMSAYQISVWPDLVLSINCCHYDEQETLFMHGSRVVLSRLLEDLEVLNTLDTLNSNRLALQQFISKVKELI